jgi:K+-transporting ATPase ATPase C chain
VRRDLLTAAVAVVALTVLCGLAYPLLVTGVAQLTVPGRADGSLVEHDGRVVGSRLIGQSFAGRPDLFQSRPSATGHAADATAFSNLGPNSARLAQLLRERAARFLRREGPHSPGLTLADVPPDAVQSSGSNVDPHISPANARIQAARVAAVRRLPRERVLVLVAEHTDGRALGILGEPAVDVLELNLALEAAR